MDKKAAVAKAKDYVEELYEGDKIADVALKELAHDDERGRWLVTVGFTRPSAANNVLKQLGGEQRRSYKVVTIDETTKAQFRLSTASCQTDGQPRAA